MALIEQSYVPESDPLPPPPPGVTVAYGPWEPDPDAAPNYVGRIRRPLVGGSLDPIVSMFPVPGGHRRRRFETWREGGRKMGRWTWERRTA